MSKPPSKKRTIRVPAPKPRLPLAPPTRKHEDKHDASTRKKWRQLPPPDEADQDD